ncbi:hypothetical protein HETIRDRAFT_385876 [Heterobasidion irregulare TC 32-1]|uniref:Uncharacterized protein n=1 Tax=Heterobasidion irregulare (strain TC 32-1) TaxID=747525 RepID=W4K5P5_HETIT|nr:uncharacterized protein HETIRDRAFT_476964 [Heterobasidion irregulare TC 32-1]ETW81143.1 hypothetical protein HETIRDRAFT_385876 [Heterobasidion irregulare TC 32-1]
MSVRHPLHDLRNVVQHLFLRHALKASVSHTATELLTYNAMKGPPIVVRFPELSLPHSHTCTFSNKPYQA